MKHLRAALSLLAPALALACSSTAENPETGPSTFEVVVTAINGDTHLPTADAPRPANHGDTVDTWDFNIQAKGAAGEDVPFDGWVRLSTKPGTLFGVTGTGASGRNIQVVKGKAAGQVSVTAMYGPTRLWAEDIGYVPAAPGKKPACSDGQDNNGNGLIDSADPGCAFADDDTEDGGSYVAGVSAPVEYALPRICDIRGTGSGTPYPYESIEVATAQPQHVVVTRVASDGFYVTDLGPGQMYLPATTCTAGGDCTSGTCTSGICSCLQDADCKAGSRCIDSLCKESGGYNSVYAFNFSTPAGMRVCDILTYFSGMSNDFFGFTEINFPSYTVSFPKEGQGTCEVPEPQELDVATIIDPVKMQRFQSQLVRIVGFQVASHLGPELAEGNIFDTNRSNCDFNGNGQVDFELADEGGCAQVCDSLADCSEWTAFSARSDFKVSKGTTMIKLNTSTVGSFKPTDNRGQVLGVVTGTLRKFSGGSLNWTIETRCADDLACVYPGCGATTAIPSDKACVRLRTTDDPDEGTN